MRRRIYLMRHAEAAYFSSTGDPAEVALTELGVEQAQAAGRMLRAVRFDRILTSGLPRTVHTAELVVGSSLTRRRTPSSIATPTSRSCGPATWTP